MSGREDSCLPGSVCPGDLKLLLLLCTPATARVPGIGLAWWREPPLQGSTHGCNGNASRVGVCTFCFALLLRCLLEIEMLVCCLARCILCALALSKSDDASVKHSLFFVHRRRKSLAYTHQRMSSYRFHSAAAAFNVRVTAEKKGPRHRRRASNIHLSLVKMEHRRSNSANAPLTLNNISQ